jgi:hypothetical protein
MLPTRAPLLITTTVRWWLSIIIYFYENHSFSACDGVKKGWFSCYLHSFKEFNIFVERHSKIGMTFFFRDKFENPYHYHMYLVYLEIYMDGEDI